MKSKNYFSKLFPTKSSFVIFLLYIILFANHGILVTSSQTLNNQYNYNVVTVVLLTEVLKLLISVALYCKDHSPLGLISDIQSNKNVLALYLIPAFLYCLYNNLSYANLLAFDPTTYNLLLQFRIFITAILFQLIFKNKLSKKQWFSLVLLTLGCMFKQVSFGDSVEFTSSSGKLYGLDLISMSTLMIALQMGCSCFAGVYNEYLLKNDGANVNMYVQNVFMYLDSIACNSAILLLNGNLFEAFSYESLSYIFNHKVLLIMINNAIVGIITSFFLKQLNSIVKTFASALELVLTAILCYLLFDIPIYLNTVLSMVTVLCAVFIYTQNPVKGQEVSKQDDEELIMENVLIKS